MGLLDIGYHLIIDRDGNIHRLRDLETVASHTPGYNHVSIGVCLVGGLDAKGNLCADEWTPTQHAALAIVCRAFLRQWPEARVVGHNELKGYRNNSKCPAYDMHALRKDVTGARGILRTKAILELLKGSRG